LTSLKLIIAICDIHFMNFRNFDLNLLRVLDGMLAARNTTRVGEAMGLSQPAVSSALGRLRNLLDDPLFVREGNALVPTEIALSLQEPVRSALASLEAALSGGGPFDPARLSRNFVIGASDYFHEMLMPKLAGAVSRDAPNVRLKMLPASTDSFAAMLTADQFDMVLSVAVETPSWIESKLAFRASNAVTARRGHPLLTGLGRGDPLPLDLFCGLPHAIFSVTEDFTHFEDAALQRIGRTRNVQMSVAGYYGVGRIVAQSDLLGVLPTRFALSVAEKLGLRVYRMPFEETLVEMFLYWRQRDTTSREQAWLRNMILDLLAPSDETRFPIADADFRGRTARKERSQLPRKKSAPVPRFRSP
jgi:DNA-binding transcriptional LysR family regulator